MPKALPLNVPRRPHGVRYPWRDWFELMAEAGSLTLTRWEDFLCEPASFGIAARIAGDRLGVTVRAEVEGQRVRLTRRP
jgi:hypothetical protein